jgi:hypothetical protein
MCPWRYAPVHMTAIDIVMTKLAVMKAFPPNWKGPEPAAAPARKTIVQIFKTIALEISEQSFRTMPKTHWLLLRIEASERPTRSSCFRIQRTDATTARGKLKVKCHIQQYTKTHQYRVPKGQLYGYCGCPYHEPGVGHIREVRFWPSWEGVKLPDKCFPHSEQDRN